MENQLLGAMGPVSGLLASLLSTVAALSAGAVHARRWRDRRGFRTMPLARAALSAPAVSSPGASVHGPWALAWRWPTGFTPEWRRARDLPGSATVRLRTGAAPTTARGEAADR